MHMLAYFDCFPSLKCHPCCHDKKPLVSLNKIIIEVIFFLHT